MEGKQIIDGSEMEEKAEAFTAVPLLVNRVESGKIPPLSMERSKELGFRLDIFPVSTLRAATRSIQKILDQMRPHGPPMPIMDQKLLPLDSL